MSLTIKNLTLALAFVPVMGAFAQGEDPKLTGTLIGSPGTEGHELECAMDGDNDTNFYSYNSLSEAQRHAGDNGSFRNNWIPFAGLDLGTQHVITKVRLQTPVDGVDMAVLGVFQGANNADFTDAVPLFIIPERIEGGLYEATVSCSKGFRYVRFVGSSVKNSVSELRCSISELAFFGHEGEGDDGHYYQLTNLPTVVINTTPDNPSQPWLLPQAWDKEDDIASNVIFIADNAINLQATATTRERGNNSRQYAKKPMRIKFDAKQKPMDATAIAKKWTLINSGPDNTLMRNALAFEVSRRVGMEYVPYCREVDVVYNGEYKGTYQFCDQVELAAGRIEGDELKAKNTGAEEITGAYHCEIDYYANQEAAGCWFEIPNGFGVTIKSPDLEGDDENPGPTVPEQYNYIKDYWTKAFRAADQNTPNRLDFIDGWKGFFDEDSWYRYVITEEIVGNRDASTSIHTVKRRNDPKIRVACVWDHDKAFGNGDANDNILAGSSFKEGNSAGACQGMVRWMTRTTTNSDTAPYDKGVSNLWNYLRNTPSTGVSSESLGAWIETKREEYRASANLNFKRWGLNDAIAQEEKASYDAAVNHLKSWVQTRITNIESDVTNLIGRDETITTYPVPETYGPTDNLALYKHATATTANNVFPPFMAIDGIENTVNNWWQNSIPMIAADTEGVKLQNFTVDLGNTYKVNKVVVYWRDIEAGKVYDIQLSNDGEHYLTVKSETAGNELPIPEEKIYRMGEYTLDNYYNARYVRVQGLEPANMGAGYTICELMVYGKDDAEAQEIPANASDAVNHEYDIPDPTESLAYGKTAVATSAEGDNVASNVCDGSMGTRWATGSRQEETSEEDFKASNITIDLGDYHYITTIYTYWETAFGKDYDLQVSVDGETFTTVKEVRNGTIGSNHHDLDTPMTGRYVRMQGVTPDGAYGYSLWELLVYGEPMQEVTIGKAGYATTVLTHPADLSKTALLAGDEDAKVFRVSSIDDSGAFPQARLTTDGVAEAPTGEALVVRGNTGTYRLWRLYEEPDALADNLLKASDGNVYGNQSTIYAMASKNGGVGFYLVANGVQIYSGKAYLEIPVSASAKGVDYIPFDFTENVTNTIYNLTIDNLQFNDNAIYDLSGRKIANGKLSNGQMPKGIYIINGKKMVVR